MLLNPLLGAACIPASAPASARCLFLSYAVYLTSNYDGIDALHLFVLEIYTGTGA